uniref:Flavin-containing monooxygenase n=3 Tax=Parascaris univalens TaxID=6257 RepID=A0A915AXD7_PARUN
VLPSTVSNDYMEGHYDFMIGHCKYGLRPHHRFFQQPFTITDKLPNLLSTGRIVITGDYDYADVSGVVVEGGRRFEADVIIYATGYTFKFPHLSPQSIIPIKENEVDLYKSVFPLDYPSLAVIGLIEPVEAIAPIAELQSRWVAAVFSGRVQLPSKQMMRSDIDHTRTLRSQRYYKSPRNVLRVDYMKYMDEISALIGCKPHIWKYALSDPWFAFRLFVGANAPYVYRLQGEGSWPGAKNALISLHERVKTPLKNRECRMRRYKRSGNIDHYFWYLSLKGVAEWIILLLITSLWAMFSAPSNMFISYSVCVLVFLNVFALLMHWFDRQFSFITSI